MCYACRYVQRIKWGTWGEERNFLFDYISLRIDMDVTFIQAIAHAIENWIRSSNVSDCWNFCRQKCESIGISIALASFASFKPVTSRLLSPRAEGGEREDSATPASFTCDDDVGLRWLMTRHVGYIRTYI